MFAACASVPIQMQNTSKFPKIYYYHEGEGDIFFRKLGNHLQVYPTS
jgi:hypothetical protein